MYMKRFYIKNFGPIRDLELNFEKNKAYHFVSDNDNGKSMLIDAMKILCNNIADIHVQKYVSDYADKFYLECEDFDGNIITLTRGAGLATYTLRKPDGYYKEWEKVRGKVPDEVKEIINIYVDDEKDELFNFRYADDKILFMNTTAGENYSFFQKALRTDNVIKSLKRANREEREMQNDLDLIREKVEFEESKLEDYPDINYVEEEINLYKESVEDVYNRLGLIDKAVELMRYVDDLGKVCLPDEVKDFNSKDFENKFKIIELCKHILDNEKKCNNLDNKLKVSGSLKDLVKDLKVTKEILGLIEAVKNYEDTIEVIGNKVDEIEGIKEVLGEGKLYLENYLDVENKLSKLGQVDTVKKGLEKNKLLRESLREIRVIKEVLVKNCEVNKCVEELISCLDVFKEKINGVKKHKVKVKKLDRQFSEFMVKNKICPVVYKKADKKCPFTGKGIEELVEGINRV